MNFVMNFWDDIKKLSEKYPDVKFILEDNGDDQEVYIASIMRINSKTSRKGMGYSLLKEFGDICDVYGVNCELQIEEYSAKDKLTKLYSPVGFYTIEEYVSDNDSFIRMRREHNTIRRTNSG